MFCSGCGAEVSGKFCSSCGARVSGISKSIEESAADWSREVRYGVLARVPEVRAAIARSAAMAEQRRSAGEFLARSDYLLPVGVPAEQVAESVRPVYVEMGTKTGKTRSETLAIPPGTVIVAALCSLARHGQVLRHVTQLEEGCLLEAVLPSDAFSWEGQLVVGIRAAGEGTHVYASTRIEGQLFDWGKSRRCLKTLFADVKGDSS